MNITDRTCYYFSMFTFLIQFLVFSGINVHAQEVIQNYDTNVVIDFDGSLNVSEKITVTAEGKEIKRGIYRDFPTQYKDVYGNNYKVKFELLSVLRNGHSEDYHTETIRNGIRIYIGNKNRILEHGTHIFTLEYYTNRQLLYSLSNDLRFR